MKMNKLNKINNFKSCFNLCLIVLLLCSFALPGNAFAQQGSDNCIPCSDCDTFELWRFMCTYISQICDIQGLPTEFCEEQREICDKNIDDLITRCRGICNANCNGEEEDDCHTHEDLLWLDNNDYDIKVIEKGCTGTCGTEYLVEFREEFTPGSEDHCGEQAWIWLESGSTPLEVNECYRVYIHSGTAICGPMIVGAYKKICPECEPTGTCNGGVPDGTCEAGENCPEDVGSCPDNTCMTPTCEDGCGETHISSGSRHRNCNDYEGCPTPPCSCDGQGNCIGSKNCQTHEDPAWISGDHILQIIQEGCTEENGCYEMGADSSTEYLVEVKDDDYCGEQLWLWVDEEMNQNPPEIGKCYDSFIMKYEGDCNAYVIRYLYYEVDCPGCVSDECANTACGAANTDLPCQCGTARATADAPWCCAADSNVYPTDFDCITSPSCSDQSGNCRIDISFNKDEFCPGDNLAMTLEFLEDGNYIDYREMRATLKKPTESDQDLSEDFTRTDTGIYVTYGGIGNTTGERTLEVEALFGGCEEEASASYTVLSGDDPGCESREDTECLITTTFDKEFYCEDDDITITTEFRSNDILKDPTYFGVMVDRIGTSVDISDRYVWQSEGVYIFEGTLGSEGVRTLYATAYFDDGCHATETQDFFVYSTGECPEEPVASCPADFRCETKEQTVECIKDYFDGKITKPDVVFCTCYYDPENSGECDEACTTQERKQDTVDGMDKYFRDGSTMTKLELLCSYHGARTGLDGLKNICPKTFGDEDCSVDCTQYECPKLTGDECNNDADVSVCHDAWKAGCLRKADYDVCESESESSCPTDFRCETLTQIIACHDDIAEDGTWTAQESENMRTCADEWELSHDIECSADRLVGDIDGDDLITTDDSTLGSLIIVGYLNPPSDLCCVDTSDDDRFALSDVQRIEHYILGNIDCFPRGYTCSAPENCDDTIDNNCNGEINEGCASTACTDTDTGKNYYVKGEVYCSTQDFSATDWCRGDYILEYYCEGDRYKEIVYECPNGCDDGACIGEPIDCTQYDCPKLTGDGCENKADASACRDAWQVGCITDSDVSLCEYEAATSCPADFRCETLTQVIACRDDVAEDGTWTAQESDNLKTCTYEWELSHDIECPADRLVGDIDGDSLITTDDSTIGSLILVDYLNPPSDLCCVDTSNNDRFDISDVSLIEQYIAGNIDCFPRGYTCSIPGNCDDTITFNLHKGENRISFPVIPGNNSVVNVFKPILGSLSIVWTYDVDDNDHWKKYDPSNPFPPSDDLKEILPGRGYIVTMETAADLEVKGTKVLLTADGLEDSLKTGWNMVGPGDKNIVLANKVGLWRYDQDSEYIEHTTLEIGKGYWINCNSTETSCDDGIDNDCDGLIDSDDDDCSCTDTTPCTDSDGGDEIYVRGTVTYCDTRDDEKLLISKTDECLDSTHLWENYCGGPNDGAAGSRDCPNGCKDGACIKDS